MDPMAPRKLNATIMPEGIQMPNTPIANPNLPFPNHWKSRVAAATTATAPPTPSRSRLICRMKKLSDDEDRTELAALIANPTVRSVRTPYLPIRRPPRIDMNRPGTATSHKRVPVMVKLVPYSWIIIGNSGGMACMEKMKANLARKLTKSALDSPE